MRFYHSHLQTAVSLLQTYNCSEPFAAFLKKHFSAHKQFGSHDRRSIAAYCYAAFRLGPAGLSLPNEERICAGLLLTRSKPHPLLEALRPHYNQAIHLPLVEKLHIAGLADTPFSQWFPGTDHLSDGLELPAFVYSHWQQPLLYLRVRPGHAATVQQKLQQAGIAFQLVGSTALALPNGTDVSGLLAIDREVVVQDYSSQQTGQLLQRAAGLLQQKTPVRFWDCCAASGGKSILATDLLPGVELQVSDLRASILHNLRERFRRAGISNYHLFEADLSKPGTLPASIGAVDLLWADVPCSGSGTWGRTPEQLVCHSYNAVERYVNLQRSILRNALPALRKGGALFYTTCSAFAAENEQQTQWLQQQMGLQRVEQQLYTGYTQRADTMFAALLVKA